MLPSVGNYPCAVALIAIGQPSIEPLLDVIQTSSVPEQREIAADAIRYISDRERSLTLVHERMKRSLPEEKQNLETAMELIKRLPE